MSGTVVANCAWCGKFFTKTGITYDKPFFCSRDHRKAYRGNLDGMKLAAAVIERECGPEEEPKPPKKDWFEWLKENA